MGPGGASPRETTRLGHGGHPSGAAWDRLTFWARPWEAGNPGRLAQSLATGRTRARRGLAVEDVGRGTFDLELSSLISVISPRSRPERTLLDPTVSLISCRDRSGRARGWPVPRRRPLRRCRGSSRRPWGGSAWEACWRRRRSWSPRGCGSRVPAVAVSGCSGSAGSRGTSSSGRRPSCPV